jgi:DNA-binding NarL/FixJ family response regulator
MDDALTVVIADDHPLFRKGVADVLRADSAVQLVGEASDGDTALRAIREKRPRVAVLDVEMPGRSGLDVARALRDENLPVATVLLTMHSGSDMLQRALSLGVLGYVSKESAADEILACVHLVASGRTYVSASLGRSDSPATHAASSLNLSVLTPSERSVLKLIARNLTTREIAAELGISPKTVENHRSNICQKLDVTGNNALVRLALEHAGELRTLA